jgi:hypothetical protein
MMSDECAAARRFQFIIPHSSLIIKVEATPVALSFALGAGVASEATRVVV